MPCGRLKGRNNPALKIPKLIHGTACVVIFSTFASPKLTMAVFARYYII